MFTTTYALYYFEKVRYILIRIIRFMSDALMAPRKKRNEFNQAIAKSILENYRKRNSNPRHSF